MKVQVTAEDIANGVRTDCHACPIALALLRETGIEWKVASNEAENEDGGRVLLPFLASQFVHRFDMGARVKPFDFEVSDQ